MYGLEELLDELDASRERLLVAIEPLSDAALLEKGILENWSVADLLAIQTSWEAELVTGLMRLDQGKRPDKLLAALKQPDAYEAARYAESQARGLDVIFDDFQRVRLKLEEWLESFSERALTDPRRFKWLRGKSLADIVAQVTFQHEARYLPALEAFARRWEAAQESIIPLTAVSPTLAQEEPHDDNDITD